MILGKGPILSMSDVPWLLDEFRTDVGVVCENEPRIDLAGRPLEELERQAIMATLHREDGNRTRAARLLGISDRTLREKVKKYSDIAPFSVIGAD